MRGFYSGMNQDDFVTHMKQVRKEEEKNGTPMFMGIPDHWFEKLKWRCRNGHISGMILKSEVAGDLCLKCGERVMMTFPEDSEG